MCNVRNWTLRKQITVLFVVSTVLFLILLAAVVTVNLIIMHNETRESVRERLAENTSSNMGFIVQESGSAVTQEISLLSNVNSQINSLLSIASNQVPNLMETAVFTTARDPTLTYSGLQTASGITFQQSTRYNALVSFDASAVYYPNPSILTQTFTGQADFNNFIKSSGSLDKYLPSMLQNERAQDIMYVNIYYVQGTAEVLRVYPAYPIPSSYSPKTSIWYTATQAMGTNSGIAWKKAIGPYIDQKGSGQKLFAISLPLVQNGALIGAIAIEFLTSPIDELVNSITFLSTGQALLINSDYNIFSAPQNWQLSPSTIFSVNSATVRSLVGNISSFITSSVTAISDETGTTTIATVERIPNPSNTTTVSYYVAKAFFDSTQMVDSGWLYGLILYTEVSDADQVNSDLTSLMNSDLLTIGIITLVAIVLMLLIVFIVSFRISTRISTPLMKLKEFSDLVHKNAAHKTRSDEYFKEYENDEGIIGELIHTYKKVIGISAEPIKSRYSKNQTSRKEEIEYPLNQFHADFITKTQGESPINWKGLIDQIPNEKKTN